MAEIAKPAAAREASGRLAGKQISTHPTLAVRTSFSCHPMIYYPRELFYTRMAGRGVTCYFCTRRWKSVCQRAYARTDSACHTSSLPALFIMNNEGVWGETPCSRAALPEWRGDTICHCRTRRRQPFCQKAHARSCGGHTRMMKIAKPVSSARDVGSQFAKKHMLAQIMPAARALSPHFSIVLVKGVWGLCPHDYP